MATSKGLRTPEPLLSTSRQQFIQSLESKKQFEADCVQIIPVLDLLWEEKIWPLTPHTADEYFKIARQHFGGIAGIPDINGERTQPFCAAQSLRRLRIRATHQYQ